MKFLAWLIIALMAVPVVFACETVTDGMVLVGDLVELCKGNYNLSQGITLAGNDTIVDCGGSFFVAANRSVVGFTLSGDKGELRKCDLRGFGVGIRLADGAIGKVRYTLIHDGAIGVHVASGKLIDSPDLTFRNNSLDKANASIDISKYLPSAEPSKLPVSVPKTNVSVKNTSNEPIVSTAGAAISTKAPLPGDVERMLVYIKGFVIAIVTIGFAVFLVWEVKRGVGSVVRKVARR